MVYNIYVGFSSRFGGAEFYAQEDFPSEADAVEYARDIAIQEYQNYEGCHDIYGLQNIQEEYQVSSFDDFTKEELEKGYLKEIEPWVEYCVTPANNE